MTTQKPLDKNNKEITPKIWVKTFVADLRQDKKVFIDEVYQSNNEWHIGYQVIIDGIVEDKWAIANECEII